MRRGFQLFAAQSAGRVASIPSTEADHLAAVQRELQKLVLVYGPVSGKKSVSAAEIISRTAFCTQKTAASRCCSGEVADWQIAALPANEQNRVCVTCLERRLHFLSSEHFCHFTCAASTEKRVEPEPGSAIEKQLKRSFGSVAHFEEEVRTFALSKGVPGWTWLVWNPKAKTDDRVAEKSVEAITTIVDESSARGRLEVVNFPGNMTPLTVGLWPVACFNITDRAVTLEYAAALKKENSAGVDAGPPPSWSRAARNPAAAAARKATSRSDDISLESLRSDLISRSLAALNYGFLNQQLLAALKQFAAGKYDEQVAVHLKAVAQRVKGEFMRHQPEITVLEDLSLSDAPNISSTTTAEPAEEHQQTSPPEDLQQVNVAEVSTPEKQDAFAADVQAGGTETADAAAGSLPPEEPTYRYEVRDDGVEVFIYSDKEYTERSPERTVYYKPDGTVIVEELTFTRWTFSDGSETTQFSDGRIERKGADGNILKE
jgi:superoxide dismutase